MNVNELRDLVIEEAIVSVEKHEKEEYRKEGCLEGLELCRALATPAEFRATLESRQRHEQELRAAQVPPDQYWRYRCATAQVEFVWERLKVAWGIGPTQSALATLQVARLLRGATEQEIAG